MTDVIDFRGTYRALSNFADFPVTINGWKFPTGEHAFAAMKYPDPAQWEKVLAAESPGAAKRLGRTGSLRPDWETFRVTAMQMIISAKTVQNPDVLECLLSTGDAPLVEANTWHDNFWGDCECGRPSCHNVGGTNMLGTIWMAQREYWRT